MVQVFHDSETPANGQQVITVVAFIHEQFSGVEKLFWPKRSGTKKFLPDVCELPGGHINFGEDLIAGLIREIKEELTMSITVSDAFAAFTYINEVKGSHSVEVVYFAKFADPIARIKLNPEDHSTYGWFAESELEREFIASRPSGYDPDVAIIRKGFALLRGEKLNFG